MDEDLQSAVAENPDTAEAKAGSPDTAPASEPVDVGALTAERDRLAQERAELQDRLLRLQADFENFRRRVERERMEFAEYAGEQVVRALLPVIDDFERALAAAANQDSSGGDFLRGIELIYSRLLDILKKLGVEPIQTEGTQFDPHLHQAVQRVESDQHPDGAVVRELQRGYQYKGRLLRPSMVQVAVKD